MSRKDYAAIAKNLSRTRPNGDGPQRAQWTADICAVADALADDNNRFDRTRFYLACEEG